MAENSLRPSDSLAGRSSRISRPRLPQERGHPWFSLLLDAYAFLDAALGESLRAGQRQPVCGASCYACCIQPIPASMPEVLGIRHFLGEARPVGRTTENWRCPFLDGANCSIYPVRPFACRNFLVFGHICAVGEDPAHSRPQDVFQPPAGALLHALRMTLPIYTGLGLAVPAQAERDFFTQHTALLQDIFPAV